MTEAVAVKRPAQAIKVVSAIKPAQAIEADGIRQAERRIAAAGQSTAAVRGMAVERLLSGLAQQTERAATRARFRGLVTAVRRAAQATVAQPAGRAGGGGVGVGVGGGVGVVAARAVAVGVVDADKIKRFFPVSSGEYSGGNYNASLARKV